MSQEFLRFLAMGTMLLDHIGLIFFPEQMIFRVLGRMAFPIYAFFLAEGFRHTKSPERYLARLLFWAAVSQLPYVWMNGGSWRLNVLCTLALALIGLRYAAKIWVPLVMAVLAEILGCDYGAYGVLLCLSFYIFWQDCPWICFLVLLTGGLLYGTVQYFGLLAFPVLCFYHGKRKHLGHGWAAYAFYPVHMAVLMGIKMMLELG